MIIFGDYECVQCRRDTIFYHFHVFDETKSVMKSVKEKQLLIDLGEEAAYKCVLKKHQ